MVSPDRLLATPMIEAATGSMVLRVVRSGSVVTMAPLPFMACADRAASNGQIRVSRDSLLFLGHDSRSRLHGSALRLAWREWQPALAWWQSGYQQRGRLIDGGTVGHVGLLDVLDIV
jgi:hypothetical protein